MLATQVRLADAEAALAAHEEGLEAQVAAAREIAAREVEVAEASAFGHRRSAEAAAEATAAATAALDEVSSK